MDLNKFFSLGLLCLVFFSCADPDDNPIPQGKDDNPATTTPEKDKITDNGWLIPFNKIVDGGPGRDGIAAINEPVFIPNIEADYLEENSLVVGLKIGDEARAYPHAILDRHEIINDHFGETPVGVTFCYLTGSAIGLDRRIEGNESLLGVSGLLYNSNLIFFDRASDSHWSQMLLTAVEGEYICSSFDRIPLVEMSWKSWKAMYPDGKVLSTKTGFDRDYSEPPLSSYVNNESSVIFPVYPLDERLGLYERVHGVIEFDKAKVYELSNFDSGVKVVEESFIFGFEPVVVVGSQDAGFVVSFYSRLEDGTSFSFSPVQGKLPIVMKDTEGNEWNIWGKAVSGPRMGTSLRPTSSFTAYWYAWGAFYPGAEIYGEGGRSI